MCNLRGFLPFFYCFGVAVLYAEVYELFQDPRDSSKWFFNGLRFSDNQYVTGTFDPDAADPASSLEVESDITGQIETLVIVPDL